MTRVCPTCSRPIPAGTRSRFCPHCSLLGAIELHEEESSIPHETGQTIGDYRIGETLGRGGMGIVYRAQQRSLDRNVAVKVLVAGEFADATTRRRFQAEAAAAARLRHPHIVAIHEIGEHEGKPFFSMELVEGRTFADLLREGPLPPATAARLLLPVVEAIEFAHEQGVLHRDLKPSNLLLDTFGEPRVTDFGLARQINADERFTLTGEVLGSPSYLSPEQARGERKGEGPWSDVYSLGAILYHMLTGRPPFLGGSPQSILQQVADDIPLAPRRLNPTVPADLETICLKCLEKDPGRRYTTARALAEELGRFQRNEPLQARPVGMAGRAWRWCRRHPARFTAAAAVVAMMLTLSIVPSLAYLRVRGAERAKEIQLRETLLSQARSLRLSGRSGQQREAWAALTQASVIAEKDRDPEFTARLRREAVAVMALNDAWSDVAVHAPEEPDATYLSFDAGQETHAHGSFRGPVRVARAMTGKPIAELTVTNRTIQHVLNFSRDGRYLAMRHKGEIAIWDLTNRTTAVVQPSWLNRYSFRPDSKAAAFLLTNGSVGCFSLPAGERLWEWKIPGPSGAGAILFSPNGDRLALGAGGSRGIEIREPETGQLIQRLRMPSRIMSLAWSMDGRWFAAGAADGRVNVWDLQGDPGSALRQSSEEGAVFTWSYEAHSDSVLALAFSPDGRWLASSGGDHSARLFDARGGRPNLMFAAEAYQLSFSPDGRRFGPVWQSGRPVWIQVADAAAYRAVRAPADSGTSPALAIDRSGNRIAVATRNELLAFDSRFSAPPIKVAFEGARAAYFEESGALLGISYREFARWPVQPQGQAFSDRQTFIRGGGEVAAFSANRTVVALADYLSDTVVIFRDGEPLRRMQHPRVACVVLSPDGKWAVSTSFDQGETRLWEVETGNQLKSWPDQTGNRIAFSPDGKWLAQFGARCVVRDTIAWQPRPILADLNPNAGPADAAFSYDGKKLAVIMADHEVHLLSVPDFEPYAALEAPSGVRLHRLAWSGDGRQLAVLGAQNEVQLWDLAALRAGLKQLKADWAP